jgi:esterase
MNLYFDTLGSGPPLLVLHGFLGSGENWRTVLKPFAAHYTLYFIDLRNHGRSPHAAPHTYPTLAEDVYALLQAQGLSEPVTVLGHSMGGKVAATLALTHPDAVQQLVVVDMSLSRNAPSHQNILAGMLALAATPVANRGEADAVLAQHDIHPVTRQFLLKSFARNEATGGYSWRVNLPVLQEFYEDILAGVDDLPGSYTGPTAFIRGASSDYLSDTDFEKARTHFPSAVLYTVPDAGHWVHAENPAGFQQALAGFLNVTL